MFLIPRDGGCIGWHCLTVAQKFGIIFSAIVAAIMLLLTWMYYLGRLISSRRPQRQLDTLPGDRRQPRNPNVPQGIVLGELPIAQPPWLGGVVNVPAVFRMDPRRGTAEAYPWPSYYVRQPVVVQQPAAVPPCVVNMPPPPPVQMMHASQGPGPFVSPGVGYGIHQPPHQQQQPFYYHPFSPPRACRVRTHAPLTWSQKLGRMLGLPVGKARTIASSESGESRGNGRYSRAANRSEGELDDVQSSSSSIIETQNNEGEGGNSASPENVCSLASRVATVHSDDYDSPVDGQDMVSGFQQARVFDRGEDATSDSVPSCSSVSGEVESEQHKVKKPEIPDQRIGATQSATPQDPGPVVLQEDYSRSQASQSTTTTTRATVDDNTVSREGHQGRGGHSKNASGKDVLPRNKGHGDGKGTPAAARRAARENARMKWDKWKSDSFGDQDDGPGAPVPHKN